MESFFARGKIPEGNLEVTLITEEN